MKKLNLMLLVIVGAFICFDAKAQKLTDYYPGKWIVSASGTPAGEVKMTFFFERKDGRLCGTVQDSTGKIKRNITSIEEKDKTITVYFSVPGYDLSLVLDPLDDNHVNGILLNMFEAKGVRIQQEN